MTYILRENLVRNSYNGRKFLANGEKSKIIEVDEELYQYIAAKLNLLEKVRLIFFAVC